MRSALAATAVVAALGLVSVPATADPAPPANASDAQKQLAELNKQAEIITEQVHQANDDLAAKQRELDKANTDAASARNTAADARAQEDQYREHVDQLAAASFQGARFNQVAALLTSRSTQQFLDQMSALDVLATDSKDNLDRLSAVVAEASDAEKQAKDAQARADKAAADAATLVTEVNQRKQDMEQKLKLARDQYSRLSTAEQRALRSPLDLSIIDVPPGSAGSALQKALNKRGSDYVWGATGPSTFDCSGLVYWAYKQIGITLPRSAEAQSQVGRSVPRSQVQAGDLVFFYSPVSHVGIAVDNSHVVHAPTQGDVVKISPIDYMQFNSARRIGG